MALVGLSIGNIFTTDTPEEVFKCFGENGLNSIDFGLDNFYPAWQVARGNRDTILEKSMEEIEAFFRPHKEAAAKYGVAFHQLHAPFPSYFDDDPEMTDHIREIIIKTIRLCKYFDSPYIVVHPMMKKYDDRVDADEEWDMNIKFYSSLIQEARKANTVICLENMFAWRNGKGYEGCCADPNEAAAYVDELNTIAGEKRFAFCYDTGHGFLTGHDVYNDLVRLGDCVEVLHIHDNDGVNDKHIPAYMGSLDWKRFVMGLKAIGFRGAISFEASTVNRMFPKEVRPEAYRLIAATGRYFAEQIGLQ